MAKKITGKSIKPVEQILEIKEGRSKVPVSHPNKIYWPGEKITKGMLVEYYQSVAEYILPFLKDRPESLLRNPNGIIDSGFFHKDAGEN
ncbi:MAG: DNA ligase, partial [Ferruginibacter sp.]